MVALGKLNKTIATSSNASIATDVMSKRIVRDEIVIFSHTGLLIVIEIISQFLIAWSSSLNLRLE